MIDLVYFIKFFETKENDNITRRMRELNREFGLVLRPDNKALEDIGFIGNYIGAIKDTPFDVSYTEENLNEGEYYATTILGVDLNNNKHLDMLMKNH